jgi:hypothetical protein
MVVLAQVARGVADGGGRGMRDLTCGACGCEEVEKPRDMCGYCRALWRIVTGQEQEEVERYLAREVAMDRGEGDEQSDEDWLPELQEVMKGR